ncbi:MAG TPA: transcriptional regulator [Gammaproteobacteria bacterium]|nr:transcriptional regulator [Gammaproteobacteria bacterium]
MQIDTESLFRMCADTTRLRVLMLLQQEGELCVCELTHALDLSQPKISRHLAHLRDSELLQARRNGQWVYYRINPTLPDWAQAILQHTLAGNAQVEPFRSDHRVLKQMPNRPGAACCA